MIDKANFELAISLDCFIDEKTLHLESDISNV